MTVHGVVKYPNVYVSKSTLLLPLQIVNLLTLSANNLLFSILDVDCGLPESLEHGQYTLVSNVTYYGSAVLYECDPNYELDGHVRRLCLENGTWSSGTPSCKGIAIVIST